MSSDFQATGRFFIIAIAILLCVPATASTFRFTAAGTAMTNGAPENAQATFAINPNTIVIELLNTAGPAQLNNISSTLSGVTFKLTGGAADDLVILSASAAGAVDCTGGPAICPSTTIPSAPFGWGLNLINGQHLLAAGGGGLKPYAIVNSNIRGNMDGLSNQKHNPYLLGPVTFTLSYTGTAPTGVTSTAFFFGTDSRDRLPGFSNPVPDAGVPEPSSIALAGGALLALVWRLRRR